MGNGKTDICDGELLIQIQFGKDGNEYGIQIYRCGF